MGTLTFAWNRGCREASTHCFRPQPFKSPDREKTCPQVGGPSPHLWSCFGSLDVMALHFSRFGAPNEGLEIWSATERGFSFVISKESRSGPGLHGPPGFVASWRPINVNKPAIKVGGSPFDTFAEAERACEAFLRHLTS